jgi:hypothetical protein
MSSSLGESGRPHALATPAPKPLCPPYWLCALALSALCAGGLRAASGLHGSGGLASSSGLGGSSDAGSYSSEGDGAVGWDLVQQHADCVATRGSWLDRSPEVQVFADHLHNPAHSCAREPPWTYELDPAQFFAYAGHSAECPVPAWDRARFCLALRGRPLLLVGDSTTFSTHDLLLGALLDDPYPTGAEPLGHAQFESCPSGGGHVICGVEADASALLPVGHASKVLPSRLAFVRNDYLWLNTEYMEEPDYGAGQRMYPWVHLLQPNTILLLNRGAHFVATDVVLREVEAALAYIAEQAPGALAVFRNTVGGVENITSDPRPLTERRPYSAGGLAESYSWDQFPAQNAAVRELLDSLRTPSGSGVLYLDVENSTCLRQDHHLDGLHCCIPGPQDHWVLLLMAVLEKANEMGLG